MEDNFLINDDNLQKLYGIAQSKGMPDSYEDLKSYLSASEENRRKFYDKLSSMGMPDSYEQYSAYIGQAAPVPQRTDVSDVQQAEQANVPVAEVATQPQQPSEIPTVTEQQVAQMDADKHYKPRTRFEKDSIVEQSPEAMEEIARGMAGQRKIYEDRAGNKFFFGNDGAIYMEDGKGYSMFAPKDDKEEIEKTKKYIESGLAKVVYTPKEQQESAVRGYELLGRDVYQAPEQLSAVGYDAILKDRDALKKEYDEAVKEYNKGLQKASGYQRLGLSGEYNKEKEDKLARINALNDAIDKTLKYEYDYLHTPEGQAQMKAYEEYCDQVDAMIKEAGGDKYTWQGRLARAFAGTSPTDIKAKTQQEIDEEVEMATRGNQLIKAQRDVNNARRQLRLTKERLEGDYSGFRRGWRATDVEGLSRINDFADNMTQLGLAKKVREGKELNEADKVLLAANQLKTNVDWEYASSNTMGERVGMETADQLVTTAEFLLGSYLTGSMELSGEVSKRVLSKMGSKAAKDAVISESRNLLRTGVAEGVGMAAGAGVQTFANPLSYLNMMSDYAEKRTGTIHYDPSDGQIHYFDDQKSIALSLWQAAAGAYVENLTEFSGEGLDKLGKIGMGKIYKAVPELEAAVGTVSGFLDKVKFSKITGLNAPAMDDYLRHAGFNGTLGEYGEEVLGNIVRPFLYVETEKGDSYGKQLGRGMKNLVDADQNLETLLSCAVTGVFLGATATARQSAMQGISTAAERRGLRNNLAKLDVMLDDVSNLDKNEFKDYIANHNISEISQYIKDQAKANNWSEDELGMVSLYVINSAAQQAYFNQNNEQIQQTIDGLAEQAQQLVNKWDGEHIYNVTFTDPQTGQTMQGAVVDGRMHYEQNEDGTYKFNPYISSGMLAIRLADGTVKQVSSRQVTSLDNVMTIDEQLESQGNTVRNLMESQFSEDDIMPTVESAWGFEFEPNSIVLYGRYEYMGKDKDGNYAFLDNQAKSNEDAIVSFTEEELIRQGLQTGITLMRNQQQNDATFDAAMETVGRMEADADLMTELEQMKKYSRSVKSEGYANWLWNTMQKTTSRFVTIDENGLYDEDKTTPNDAAVDLFARNKGNMQAAQEAVRKAMAALAAQAQQSDVEAGMNATPSAVANSDTQAASGENTTRSAKQMAFLEEVGKVLGMMQARVEQLQQNDAMEEEQRVQNMPVSQMEAGTEFPVDWNGTPAVAVVEGKDADGRNLVTVYDANDRDGLPLQAGIEVSAKDDAWWDARRVKPQQPEPTPQPQPQPQTAPQPEPAPQPTPTPVQPEPAPQQEQPQAEYPKDKQGKPQYDMIDDPNVFLQALVDEWGEDRALRALNAIVADTKNGYETKSELEKMRIDDRLAMLEAVRGLLAPQEEAQEDGTDRTEATDETPAAPVEEVPTEQPTAETSGLQGLDGYSESDIEGLVRQHIESVLEGSDADIEIVGIKVIGSRTNGTANEGSDLDVLVEYKGDATEDGLFNLFNDEENRLYIEGVPVDINPITEGKSGTIEQFMARNEGYKKPAEETTPVEEAPVEQPTAEAPVEEALAEEAPAETPMESAGEGTEQTEEPEQAPEQPEQPQQEKKPKKKSEKAKKAEKAEKAKPTFKVGDEVMYKEYRCKVVDVYDNGTVDLEYPNALMMTVRLNGISVNDLKPVGEAALPTQQTEQPKAEQPNESKWQYELKISKDGHTTIERYTPIEGGAPVYDARWKFETDTPVDMLELIMNLQNHGVPLDPFKNIIEVLRTYGEPAKKPTEVAPAEKAEKPTNENTIFTEDEYERRKAALRHRHRTELNIAINPQDMSDLLYMAGYHIERGVRKFADFCKNMIEDLGDWVRPYLQTVYLGAKGDEDIKKLGIDSKEWSGEDEVLDFDVENFDRTDRTDKTDNEVAHQYTDKQKKAFSEAVTVDMRLALERGEKPYRSINDIRKRAESVGMEVDKEGRDDILLQELVEDGLVRAARQVIESGRFGGAKSKEAFDAICKLYEMQPTISMRSSNRVKMQQYSTPLPMAFVADMFAYKGGKVLEPTAGNGMLVFAIPSKNVTVNELDETRLANLREQGFPMVLNEDALTVRFVGKYDSVIANPPFGSSPAKDYDGKMIAGLDEQITLNALSAMKDDGRAAIIIGGNMEYGKNGGVAGNRAFWTYLYDHYNVKGVVDMEGKLYGRQGTTYPTRMILIDGRRSEEERAQTAVYPPIKEKAVRKAESFDDLYDIVTELLSLPNKTNGNVKVLQSEGSPSVPNTDNTPGETNVSRPGAKHHANDTDERRESGETVSGGSTTENRPNATEGIQKPSGASGGQSGLEGRPQGFSQPQQHTGGNGANPVSGNTGRTGATVDAGVSGNGGATNGVGSRRQLLGVSEKRTLTGEKLSYRQHSGARSLESVAPAAMVEAMDRVLGEIEKIYGKSIDDFVRDELGYESNDKLYKALAAEQIDSVAMAIHQMKQGQAMIIGDQTGVGKGRQMAALIRWARRQGKKPIFFTKDTKLFSAIYEDLVDIGSEDLKPFIINSDGAIKYKDKVVHRPLSGNAFDKVLKSGKLPDEYDFVVINYDQVNTGDKISREEAKKSGHSTKELTKATPKATFVREIAKDNYLLLDESHQGAGDSNTGYFMQSIVRGSKAVTFSSATYAKRPDSMPLYAIKTAMSKANVKPDELIKAIEKGGVTLQEIMSRALTEAGQYVRRERDMSGVNTDWETISDPKTSERARKRYDQAIDAFNAIINFQKNYVQPKLAALSIELAEVASSADTRRGTEEFGIKNTPFASKTFNYTKQLMLALKVDAVVDKIVSEIEAGRHPVIALENTMGSFLEDFANGDVISNPTFSMSLLRGLESVMQYTVRDPDGGTTYSAYKPEDLGPEGEAAYYELQDFIRESTKDIFISPLDAIISKLNEKGYKVGELTGRKQYVEIDDEGRAVVRNRQDKNALSIMNRFNNGSLDVLIINKSGSTGISLHSSVKYDDQRQRSMVIAQPLSDINDYQQMLGRIDRTGQVHRGYYINLGLPVPAENRFLMMLSTKLKSLNANTTTSQESEGSGVEAPDLLNKYGSQVIVEYLRDNPEIYEKMGEPIRKGIGTRVSSRELDDYKAPADESVASTVTGRVALLSIKEQEEFYNDVIRRYNELIKYLDDTGTNDLKITVMPLKAKTLEKKVSSEGVDPNGSNPFAKDAYVETVEMDVLRKPMKADDVRKTIEQLNTPKGTEHGHLATAAKEKSVGDRVMEIIGTVQREAQEKLQAENERYEEAKKKAVEDIEKQRAKINKQQKRTEEEKAEAIEKFITDTNTKVEEQHQRNVMKIEALSELLEEKLTWFKVGGSYLMPDVLESESLASPELASPAIFCGYKAKDSKITSSTTFAVFATLDGRRRIEVKLSDNAAAAIGRLTSDNYDIAQEVTLDNWDSKIPTNTRKTGYIMTGNILQAVKDTQDPNGNYPGQLVSYTDEEGNVHDGILMPDKWKPGMMKNSGKPINAVMSKILNGELVKSTDGKVSIYGSGWAKTYTLTVPKTKKEGGVYFENPVILKSVSSRGFWQNRGEFRADINGEDNMRAVVNELAKLGVRVSDEQQGDGEVMYRNLEDSDTIVDNADAGTKPLTDREKIAKLEAEPKVKVYRSMVLIDGKLYPPMSSKEAEGKQMRQPSELGKWEEADEAPDKAVQRKGKWVFPLRKDNGKMLYAAYNPYIHTSRTMLNDQFSEAQSRPNLVVVEMEVPESELNGTYKAEKAKDSVGVKQWKAGVIQGQLSGTREVILTRWAKPVRIVPDDEVAENIAKQIEGQVSVMPSNVVTPQVREALEARGVQFVETNNKGELVEGEHAGETWASVFGKKAKKTRNVSKMREAANDTIKKLGLQDNVTILDSTEGLTGKRKKAKGWFDPKTGKIVIVMPNHNSPRDVVKTILHEGVAHYGLRQLVGEKNMNEFLDRVFEAADKEVRGRIIDLAMNKYDRNFRKATEEYLAGLAEDTNFDNPTFLEKVKALLVKLLDKMGIQLGDGLTDNELRYILWKSYRNLVADADSLTEVARDAAMQSALEVGNFAPAVAAESMMREDNDYSSMSNEDLFVNLLTDKKEIDNGILEEIIRRVENDMARVSRLPENESGRKDETPSIAAQAIARGIRANGNGEVWERGQARKAIKQWAKDNGYWYDESRLLEGTKERKGGAESRVFVSDDYSFVRKLTQPVFYNDSQPVLESLEMFGNVFGDTAYTIKGFGENEFGQLCIVTEQPFITGETLKDTGRGMDWIYNTLGDYMESMGFERVGRTSFKNDKYTVYDINANNVIIDGNGDLFVIDAGVKLTNDDDYDNDDILFRDAEPANKIAGEYNRMTGANVDGVKGVKRGWEEFVRGMMDDMRPLEQMQQLIAKTLGRELRDSEKAYELQTQLTSKVGRQIEREQLDYMVPMLQQVTELMQTLMENNGLSREEAYKRVNNYLLAKHGLERNEWFVKQGKKEKDRAGLRGLAENLGENPDDYKAVAERIVNEFEQQVDTKALWKSMKALTDRMLEISYETGMINKDTFEDLMQRHNYYVPLRGFADGTAADMFDYVTQSPHFQNIFQKMRGRQSMADDPLANLMSMLHSAIVIGNQNEVMQKIYNLAVNSNSDLLRITTPWYEYDDTTDTWEEKFPVIPEGATADDIDAIVSQFEADMQQKKAQGKAKRKRNRIDVGKKLLRRQAKEHEMVAYIDGKPVRMYVAGNPLVAQAMNKVNTQHLNKVMQAIQSATRWYSAINTSWSPAFGPKNAMRDIRMMLFGAYTTGGLRKVGRSAKWIAKAGWALPRLLITGKMDGLVKKLGKTDAAKVEQWWNEFLDNGGETGFTRTLNAEKAKGEVKDMIRHMMNGSKDGENRVRKYTIGLLEWIGRYSEDISRFAAYCEYRANGGSVLGSIQEAKNVTVNFNVHGGSDLAANCRALYSFFNASMQGINRMRRLATEHPKRFFAGIAAMMLSGAVLPWLNMAMFALFGGDDDDWRKYEELTEYTANHNMILYVGNHKFLSIPWSQELAPFNALGNIWFRQQMGWNKGKSVAEQWGDMLVDLSPVSVTSGKKPGVGLVKTVMPSFTTPVWEALFNEDFTGSPLYRDNQWNKYDASWEKAYTGKTSQSVVDASKWLDEKTGIDINPAIAEHLFSGILGGMGRSGDKLLRFFTNGFQLQDAPYIRTMMFDSNPKGYIGAVQREYGRNAYEVLPEMKAKVEKADAMEFARLVNTKEYQIANMVSIYKTGKDLAGNKMGITGIDKMEKEYKKLAGMSDGSEAYREQLEAVRADITEAKMEMLDEIQQVIYENSGDFRKKEIDYVRGIEERSKAKAK